MVPVVGQPAPYVEIEERLTELLGAPDTLVLPTITLIHASVIPLLAGQGAVLVDAQAHKTIYEGARWQGGRGDLCRVRANEPEHLEQVLRSLPANGSKVFCIDGVNSMTGNAPTCLSTPASAVPTTPCCTWTMPTVSGSW